MYSILWFFFSDVCESCFFVHGPNSHPSYGLVLNYEEDDNVM